MGDGTVIHFAAEPFRSGVGRVERATMEIFRAGGHVRIVQHRSRLRTIDETLIAAEDQLHAGDYCMFRNNCEHFATYCKTGRLRSGQVRRMAVFLGATTMTVMVIGVRASKVLRNRTLP
tara:strand:- start:279 stop:635 length:357 start_codon:yes stop_codon:yes gene_type:complete